MDEKAGGHPVAGRAKTAPPPIAAGKVDLGGILGDDDPPATAPIGGARRGDIERLLPGDLRLRQQPMDRKLAGTAAAQLPHHQRAGRGDPFRHHDARAAAAPIVVIMIGRKRSKQASRIASRRNVPPWRSRSMAKSIIMMAFFLTMPISMTMPMMPMTFRS